MLEAHIAIVFLAFFRGVSGTFRIFVFGEYLIIFDPCNERWLLVKAVDFHAKYLFPYPLSDSHEVAHEDQDCLQSIAVLIVYQEFVIIDKQCSLMVAGQQRERHASMP